jgi:hypothetical protein
VDIVNQIPDLDQVLNLDGLNNVVKLMLYASVKTVRVRKEAIF